MARTQVNRKKRFSNLKAYTKNLVSSSSIHGCFYVSNEKLHCIERIAWALLIQLAVAGTIYACMVQYNRYYARPTVMSVEKDFRSWLGTLPAATICLAEILDENKMNEFLDRQFQENVTEDDRTYFTQFILAVMNSTAENYEHLADYGGDERLDSLNLFEVAMSVRKSVADTIKITSYDPDVKLEAVPIMSEKGLCYTFNSAISDILGSVYLRQGGLRKPLSCRYGKQQCFLKVEVQDVSLSIDIHSPYEFSDIKTNGLQIEKSDEIFAHYKIMETVTSQSLRDLTPVQRKCLYPDEDVPAYSKSLCYMRCRGKMAMDMCDCIPHFYPFLDGPKCTPSGYECLLDFKWPGWSLNLCNCSRTCLELKYPLDKIVKRNWDTDSNLTFVSKSSFYLELVPPKVRNRISVVFSFEDLLVSFGGAASLFLGFSFWSLIQGMFLTLRHLTRGFCGVNRTMPIKGHRAF